MSQKISSISSTSKRTPRINHRCIIVYVVAFVAFSAAGVCLSQWLKPHASCKGERTVPKSLSDLIANSPEEIGPLDIALLNLLCAEGLPDSEDLNRSDCLMTLDQWAQHVKTETERHLYRFRANPAEYENSEGYFRMLIMAVVMYEDFGVRYNPQRISLPSASIPNDRFFADSRDIFLHGLIGNRRMGTCSSMPVLYIAIGRRLGYPLKLATTKAHLFLRWEDQRERFDLEATGKGMNRYNDEHFKQWPFPVSDEEIRTEGYLKSLTPAEELAVFLSLRGNCLKENGRLAEAASCYASAVRLAPRSNAYRALLVDAQSSSQLQHAMTGVLPPLPNQAKLDDRNGLSSASAPKPLPAIR